MVERKTLVGILGLKQDRKLLGKAAETLDNFGVLYDLQTFNRKSTFPSASNYALEAEEKGIEVIITSDRADNSVSSIVSTRTLLPVVLIPTIDIPENPDISASLQVLREHLKIMQATINAPAAIMSINEPGAINAGLAAISYLALKYPEIDTKLKAFREKQTQDVLNIELP